MHVRTHIKRLFFEHTSAVRIVLFTEFAKDRAFTSFRADKFNRFTLGFVFEFIHGIMVQEIGEHNHQRHILRNLFFYHRRISRIPMRDLLKREIL